MNGTPQEKREALGKLLAEATQIRTAAETANKGMTAEEKTRFDQRISEHDALLLEIESDEMSLRTKALTARQEAASKSITNIPAERPTGSGEESVEVIHRTRNLSAFKGPDAEKRAYYAGKWFMGAMNPNDEPSRRWARNHGLEYRVATEAINSAGGFLVPTLVEQAVIDLRESYGTARRNCRIVTMGSDSVTIPMRVSGQTAYFIGETGAPTASDKVWNQVTLTAKTCAVESRYSSNLSEDAVINIADDLARDAAWCLAAKEDSCLYDGTGASTYGGIYGLRVKMIEAALATYAGSLSAATTAAHDTFPEIDMTDLTAAMAKLPAYAAANAKWYCSQTFYVSVMLRLAAASAGNTMSSLMAGIGKQFLGYPVEIDQTLPASTTMDYTGLIWAFFGDMSQAVVLGDRRGITMLADPYSLSSNLQTKLVWSERFDIVAHSLGSATAAGPLIGLVGGSG